jgi:hypothetical protein
LTVLVHSFAKKFDSSRGKINPAPFIINSIQAK